MTPKTLFYAYCTQCERKEWSEQPLVAPSLVQRADDAANRRPAS